MSGAPGWTGKSDQIGAYWGSRSMSPSEGAQKWSRLLELLSPGSGWFRKGRKYPRELDGVIGEQGLAEELAGGVLRDDDGKVMDGGGYLVSLWNGNHDEPLTMETSLGSVGPYSRGYATVRSRSLELRARCDEVLAAMIELWAPDYAAWDNWTYTESQGMPKDRPA